MKKINKSDLNKVNKFITNSGRIETDKITSNEDAIYACLTVFYQIKFYYGYIVQVSNMRNLLNENDMSSRIYNIGRKIISLLYNISIFLNLLPVTNKKFSKIKRMTYNDEIKFLAREFIQEKDINDLIKLSKMYYFPKVYNPSKNNILEVLKELNLILNEEN